VESLSTKLVLPIVELARKIIAKLNITDLMQFLPIFIETSLVNTSRDKLTSN
jgi:hypothetical protein